MGFRACPVRTFAKPTKSCLLFHKKNLNRMNHSSYRYILLVRKIEKFNLNAISLCKTWLGRAITKRLQTHNVYVGEMKHTLDKVSVTPNKFKVVINAARKFTKGHSGWYKQPTSHELTLMIVGQQFSKHRYGEPFQHITSKK